MSGQPNRAPTDQAKFREQYLANLDLRVRLDDMNLQANKVYKRTGQLPVEPSDFRTTEEKLADTERLKIDVRSRLADIADGREANKIAQELTPKQLLFYSQFADTINPDIKKKYRMGVYAEIFLPYLVNYMNNTANVNGIMTGLQQTSGKNVELNPREVLQLLPTPEEIEKSLMKIGRELTARRNESVREVIEKKNTGLMLEGTASDLAQAVNSMRILANEINIAVGEGRNQNDINEAMKLLNDVAQELPTRVELKRWDDKLLRAIQSRDAGLVDGIIREGIELMELPVETNELMTQAFSLAMVGSEKMGAPGAYATPAKGIPPPNFEGSDDEIVVGDAFPVSGKRTAGRSGSERSIARGDVPTLQTLDDFTSKDLLQFAKDRAIKMTAKQKRNKDAIISKIREGLLQGKGLGKISGTGLGRNQVLPRKRAVIRDKDVKFFGGIAPAKRFVPFGRYIINQHRLGDDIIAIKRPSGSVIKDLPSEKVSRRLAGVIRDIVGGSIPQFEDLERLNDVEKTYLNKLASITHIKDRLSLPAPKKSDMDKEMDEFEVMKGEIMSGNDNVELVKKFKLKLMKLMKLNLIPKGQAKELLLELTELGF